MRLAPRGHRYPLWYPTTQKGKQRTVGRAYKELEAERLVETQGRNGTLVLASRSRMDDEEARADPLPHVCNNDSCAQSHHG